VGKRLQQSWRVLTVGLAAVAIVAAAMAAGAGGPGLAKAAVAAFARQPAVAAVRPGGSCNQVSGAYQMPGADGVTPAAWTGDGLTVPACGPIPNDGGLTNPVYPYPGALWTPGYQCVEFSERYLYYRYGVTMSSSTNGDQVAAHYAAAYPALFMIVRNGTPHRAPVPGDVLSMSTLPSFNSVAGGHTVVVQSSSVNAAGDGTLTVVEENAVASGIQVLPVTDWSVTYNGFPYLEWLTTVGLIVTTPTLPSAQVSRGYSATLTATGGAGPYRWAVTAGSLPPGLALSPAGLLTGTVAAGTASGGDVVGRWPFTVTATDPRGAVAVADLQLAVAGLPEAFSYDAAAGSLRDARWTGARWVFTTIDGSGSTLAGHTSDTVGRAASAVEIDGQPMVFYSDTTSGSLRAAWQSGASWRFETLDGPGSTLPGHTGDRVGSALSAAPLDGQPEVFYHDASDASLRYARLTVSGWRYQTLDGSGSALPGHSADDVGSAVAVTQLNGNAQVFYDDATRTSLRHAFWTGTAWVLETLDGPGSVISGHDTDQVGSAVSATEMPGGPQVYYADATAGSLRHTWWTPSGWRFQTLDGPGSTIAGHTGDRVGSGVAVTLH
jgi:hypothetical protein